MEELASRGVDVLRVVYPDLLGIDRGREVLVEALPQAMEHGLAFCRAVYHTTPTGETIPVPGGLDQGLPDMAIFPDLSTVQDLPWEPGVAWCLGDARNPDGSRAGEDPRAVLRDLTAKLGELGLTAIVGPELEYFLLNPDGTRHGDSKGDVYTAGRRGDPDGHLLKALRWTRDLGLGVTMANHEYAGSQFEINLTHSEALDAADRAFRFKAAIKEIARLDGRMATFMARPFDDEGGSGFHVHLSLTGSDGRNVFDGPAEPYGLTETARHAIGGLLAHAPAAAALLNPTINSYKRFGPDTLAPWLIDWGLDNRSAMLRVPPERGAGARLEVRLGDASANPYLGTAAVLAAVYLGIRDRIEPPAPLEGYGYDTSRSAVLPMSLGAALDALEADAAFGALLGKELVTSFLAYKRNEVERFERAVTDWEFREYAYHL
ncbi:glutamine synthetase family protein [Nonomuraea sp. NPDC050328]|uniref:glutamine synthetase family protein n=1 Tax=Nonomuraea sp. NPDC050328 TaxID=3364361 RepID=UPI0037BB6DDA